MDEQELKRIEDLLFPSSKHDKGSWYGNTINSLIAEVRRLRQENERLKGEVKNLENCDYME